MKKKKADIFNDLYKDEEMYYGWELRKEFLDFFEDKDLSSKVALDLGCGEGKYSIYLAQQGCKVIAVDISETGLDKLKKIAHKNHLNINTQLCDLKEFTFDKKYYDIIIAATILDHLSNNERQNVITGIIKSLRPDGIVYVNVFTDSDPGYLKRTGDIDTREIVSDTSICIEHYFQENELRDQFTDLKILYYYEGIEPDLSHGTPHYHGWACMIAQKT